jgi:hypothetical protein
MGLEQRALADWLKPRPGDDAVRAERADLIRTKSVDVIAVLPESRDAILELVGVLEGQDVSGLPRTGDSETMAAIGRAIAEDICILTPGVDGYRLTAAVLCFPNRWRLADKIGRGLLAIHGPVPDYPQSLAGAVERFLAALNPMQPFSRENWGFASQPTRHLPEPIAPVDLAQDEAFFFRGEEQGFLKLPDTRAVIFSIRTTIAPWRDVPENKRAGLTAAVATLSPAWLVYKSIKQR